jgi:hypothetical protein
MSECITASCLVHHARIFWHYQFKAWVHTSCHACDALAGDPGPDPVLCRYCGAKVDVDGGGKLWEFLPDANGQWVLEDSRWHWVDLHWSERCPASPSGTHENRVG